MKATLVFAILLTLNFNLSFGQAPTIFDKQIKDKQFILLEYDDLEEFENQKGEAIRSFIQQTEKVKNELNAEMEKYSFKHNDGILEVTEICFLDSDDNIIQGFKKGIGYTKEFPEFSRSNL